MIDLKDLINNKNQREVTKREVVKTVLAVIILKQYNSKYGISLHNNYKQENQLVDLYFEDIRKNIVILYKIITKASDEQKKKIEKNLNDIYIGFIETRAIKIIDLSQVPNNILEMEEYLKKEIK